MQNIQNKILRKIQKKMSNVKNNHSKKICKAKMIEMLFSFVQNKSKPTKSVVTNHPDLL